MGGGRGQEFDPYELAMLEDLAERAKVEAAEQARRAAEGEPPLEYPPALTPAQELEEHNARVRALAERVRAVGPEAAVAQEERAAGLVE